MGGRRRGRAGRPGAGAPPSAAQIRVWLCAKGLRAQAELAALARARRDAGAVRDRLGRARGLLAAARRAAAEAAAVTPHAAGWLAVAEAEYVRARGEARPEAWSQAAATWEGLARPPLAAYCRWRQAEALVATGGSAPRRASRSGRPTRRGPARREAPCRGAQAARPARAARSCVAGGGIARWSPGLEEILGLTSREVEVLTSWPVATPTGRSRRPSSSAPRRPASTSRIFCASWRTEPARGGRDRAPPLPAAGLTAVAARGQRPEPGESAVAGDPGDRPIHRRIPCHIAEGCAQRSRRAVSGPFEQPAYHRSQWAIEFRGWRAAGRK